MGQQGQLEGVLARALGLRRGDGRAGVALARDEVGAAQVADATQQRNREGGCVVVTPLLELGQTAIEDRQADLAVVDIDKWALRPEVDGEFLTLGQLGAAAPLPVAGLDLGDRARYDLELTRRVCLGRLDAGREDDLQQVVLGQVVDLDA